ncbi:hypothetical protein HCU40_15645 [Pseudanabaena biceps]|nr:hypothetical protein [Pseudanabaena biceps]
MSKALISNLINEINAVLSHPVGSVSRRRAEPDALHQREQLKQLRSHLENLPDDASLGNVEQQFQALVARLQSQVGFGGNPTQINSTKPETLSMEKSKTDKLEILPTLLVHPSNNNLLGSETDLVMENRPMTNGTPEPNPTFVNDRMIASLQQAIQQTLQQVVKESVQTSVQQVVSQTLAVERALMVGEISASLNKIVEAQQRSQISQELVTLNQQKQKLSSEILQLESDRAAWMQQFQEFQNSQQQSLSHSLRSVDSYLREQINDTLQQAVTITPPVIAQTAPETELANRVQEQTDRFLLQLDEMFNSTFRSLEQDIQGYQSSIEAKIGYMETLEQKGEALISALVERINQQTDQQPHNSTENPPVDNFADLPEDIPSRYLETVMEPADENLINTLLAGNQFGEAISEHLPELTIDTVSEPVLPNEDAIDANPDAEILAHLDTQLEPQETGLSIKNVSVDSVMELESILGAESEPLFEGLAEQNASSDLMDFEADDNVIHDYRSAEIAHTLNPDFDAEAATQIVESFNFPQSDLDIDEIAEAIRMADFASLDLSPNADTKISSEISEITQDQAIDDPELLRWLEESHDRPIPINLAEVSADEELMSWLGNDAIDMAKLPESSQTQAVEKISSLPELAIALDLETSATLETREIIADNDVENQLDQFFSEPSSDQVDDSDESLILLANNDSEDLEFPNWEDSLVKELNSDLARLETGFSNDPMIAANLDQFIRNTPYSLTNWEVEESQKYPTIIDIAAQTSDLRQIPTSPSIAPSTPFDQNIPPIIENPDLLFIDGFAESFEDTQAFSLDEARAFHPSEQAEVVIDFMESQSSPFAPSLSEIPDIFENTDRLFESSQDMTDAADQGNNRDDMDAIFAEVIAENAARYAQPTPFETTDELEELFVRSPDTIITEATVSEIEQKISIEEDESDLDTLLYGFDPDSAQNQQDLDTFMQVPVPHSYREIDSGAETFNDSLQFAEPIEFIEELDTILQGYVKPESINFDASAETSFAEFESLPTVIEQPSSITVSVSHPEESWSDALDQLESALSQPTESELDEPSSIDLSADEFFASLEYNKLNSFADKGDPLGQANRSNYDLAEEFDHNLNNQAEEKEEEDLLLNKFADAQTDDHSGKALDSDWENLLSDLNTFSFREPLLDDQREQLGLSSIAPIADSLESVLDIDSLVVESQRTALIPPPIEKEVYSLDDHWILGIDFGASGLRASLLNDNTGKVYLLSLDSTEELPCKLAWSANQNLDDPIASDIRLLTKKAQNSGRSSDKELEQGEVSIYQFKQFLKIGLPYRGVSSWQPIVQWSSGHQVSLRWLIAALKTLLEQIQTRAENSQLPDLGLILLKLSGVVFGYPSNWSDTYILNVREAILKAGLVKQAEQVMSVEQAIAPLLALIHERKISSDITVLIDVGAVSTSLCLAKGIADLRAITNQSQDYLAKEQASQRSKLQMLSFDYAGINISQDIIVHLFYPHWQLITNPNRHLCKFDYLSLPEIGVAATAQRILLHQYLLSSEVGQQMLELADRVKIMFGQDAHLDTWNEELMGQPLVVLRRELENLILQPFIQRINRELNAIFSNAGILGDDVSQVFLIGNTMQIPLLSRWITQKLPNVKIESLESSAIATGLAVSPLYPALHNVARQQYSDYFLLQEICRLNLTKSITPSQLLQQLQMRGINIKVCRDRILTILQGDLPAGLFPWLEPEQAMVLEDPTLSSDLYAGKLFELETDGTYQPNVTKFQQLRVYLQAITGNMTQTLNEPLVFPELV